MKAVRVKNAKLESMAKKHERMFLNQFGKSVSWSTGLQLFYDKCLIESEADSDYVHVSVGYAVDMAIIFDKSFKELI